MVRPNRRGRLTCITWSCLSGFISGGVSFDVASTKLAVAGAQASSKVEGVDLIPYLIGKQTGAPHRALFFR